MSGGYFNYGRYEMLEIAADLDELIKNNKNEELNEYGDMIGRNFTDDTVKTFKATSEILKIASVFVHRIDYLLCSDDSEETFNDKLRDDLSKEEVRKIYRIALYIQRNRL